MKHHMTFNITASPQSNRLYISLEQKMNNYEVRQAIQEIDYAIKYLTPSFSSLIVFNTSEITNNKREILEHLRKILPITSPIAIVADQTYCSSLLFSLLIFSQFQQVETFHHLQNALLWIIKHKKRVVSELNQAPLITG